MLDKSILENYAAGSGMPTNRPRALLTEYLQAEILHALYTSKYGSYLSFMGGTALRFAYRIERFSEDLDFEQIKDNLDVHALAKYLEKKLGQVGFSVETRVKHTENIIIIFVKFSDVMKQMGLSNMENQKLKIKFEIDPDPARTIQYGAEPISTFGKVFDVIVNTQETIFTQKIVAIARRPYQKGRDFYDLAWFLGQKNLEPDYALLRARDIDVSNRAELTEFLSEQMKKSNLKQAAQDVERFLFYPQQTKWIEQIEEHIRMYRKLQ